VSTAQDICVTSLEAMKVYAPGELTQSANNADLQRMLSLLNGMLDGWSTESLMTFATQQLQATLVPASASYTIGSGGVINVTRPQDITRGTGVAYVQDPSGNNYPFQFVTKAEWNMIGNRTVNSNVPDTGYYDQQFPLGVVNVFPTPSLNWVLFFEAMLQFAQFATLASVVSLPPGFFEALWSNLALVAKPFFKSRQPMDPDLKEFAREAKAKIKRVNMKTPVAAVDTAIVSRAAPTYNIYTDNR
jgi:hypothetical protein